MRRISANAKHSPRGSGRNTLINREFARELEQIGVGLRFVYSTSLAVQLALRRQNADQDSELADCLRSGVCDPVSNLAQMAQAILQRIGGSAPLEP